MPNTGKVKQIIGAVVDVQFEGKLPEIYNALELKSQEVKPWYLKCSSTSEKTASAPSPWTVLKAWFVEGSN